MYRHLQQTNCLYKLGIYIALLSITLALKSGEKKEESFYAE
jgi:hypothetical protein